MKKDNRGGPGRGQGNKPGSMRVEEKRKQYHLTILPSIMNDFKIRHGRGWSRRVEELIKADIEPNH